MTGLSEAGSGSEAIIYPPTTTSFGKAKAAAAQTVSIGRRARTAGLGGLFLAH